MYDKLLKCLNEKSESDAEEVQWIFWIYDRSIWKRSEDEENFIDQNHLQPNRDSVDFLRDLAYWLVDNDKIDTDELLEIYWETSQSIWEDNKYELYPEYKRLFILLVMQEDKIDYLESILK